MPLFSRSKVARLQKRRDLDGLIDAFSDKEGTTANDALRALVELDDSSAVSKLLTALGHQDPWVRWRAAAALGDLGDPRAVEPLIAALGDLDVRHHAVPALGKLGDERAFDPLVEALRDQELQHASALALGELGDARAVPLIVEALDNATHLDADAMTCRRLIDALSLLVRGPYPGHSPRREAMRALVDLLTRDNWRVRAMSSETLGEIGSARGSLERYAVEALVGALGDESDSVRLNAAKALRLIGGPEAEAGLDEARGTVYSFAGVPTTDRLASRIQQNVDLLVFLATHRNFRRNQLAGYLELYEHLGLGTLPGKTELLEAAGPQMPLEQSEALWHRLADAHVQDLRGCVDDLRSAPPTFETARMIEFILIAVDDLSARFT